MTCEEVRVALSARLDGEDGGVAAGAVDNHVDGCPECADWAERACHATHAALPSPADVPDLIGPLLAALSADRRRRFTADSQVLRAVVAGRG
jgi:predicted anti-sigma-YlaC factor YlaD